MNEQMIQALRANPQVQAKVQQAVANLRSKGVTVEQVDKILQVLAFVLKNPTAYPRVRDEAIKSGVLSSSQLPERFDPKSIVGMVVIIQMIKEAMGQGQQQGYAKGGLAAVAAKGRHGDTILAHINPVEADILRSMGGKGTKNPETGLPEFGFLGDIWEGITSAVSSVGNAIGSVWDSAKDVLSVAAPIVLGVVAPGLGTALGSMIGFGGTAASIIGSAALGAGISGITGGNVAQGALMGGLGGGLGSVVGGAINDATGLGQGASNIAGSGLIGGAYGAATGEGFAQGAGQGVLGGTIGELAGAAGSGTALGTGVGSAGRSMGNALIGGADTKSALTAGTLAGLYSGTTFKPSDAVVSSLEQGNVSNPASSNVEQSVYGTTPEATSGADVSNLDLSNIENAPAGNLPSNVNSKVFTTDSNGNIVYKPGYTINTPSDGRGVPQMAVPTQSGTSALVDVKGNWVEQNGQMTFKPDTGTLGLGGMKPSVGSTGEGGGVLGTGISPTAAIMGGLTLANSLSSTPAPVQPEINKLSASQQEYMNRPSITWNWTQLQNDANAANQSLSQYIANNWNKVSSGAYNNPVSKARGGALAMYAQGAGTGRSDEIDAKLSDGEYVIDAETVAMLGDGSNKAGAQKLDQMRAEIRKQKGRMLAKGKISPNAKSPLAYIKGIA